jgi:hypothetical protein
LPVNIFATHGSEQLNETHNVGLASHRPLQNDATFFCRQHSSRQLQERTHPALRSHTKVSMDQTPDYWIENSL